MRSIFLKLMKNDGGATLTKYVIVGLLIAIVAIVAVRTAGIANAIT